MASAIASGAGPPSGTDVSRAARALDGAGRSPADGAQGVEGVHTIRGRDRAVDDLRQHRHLELGQPSTGPSSSRAVEHLGGELGAHRIVDHHRSIPSSPCVEPEARPSELSVMAHASSGRAVVISAASQSPGPSIRDADVPRESERQSRAGRRVPPRLDASRSKAVELPGSVHSGGQRTTPRPWMTGRRNRLVRRIVETGSHVFSRLGRGRGRGPRRRPRDGRRDRAHDLGRFRAVAVPGLGGRRPVRARTGSGDQRDHDRARSASASASPITR